MVECPLSTGLMVEDALRELSSLVAVGMTGLTMSKSKVAALICQKQGDLITMMSNRSDWQADETEPCMQMAPRTWYS